jgi:hypothetical protein
LAASSAAVLGLVVTVGTVDQPDRITDRPRPRRSNFRAAKWGQAL